MIELQNIYLNKISEVLTRINKCENLLNSYSYSKDDFDVEHAALQMRKALEAIAFAAIAPNKREYAQYRAKVDRNPDFTKDFKASSIIKSLSKINKDFYPIPLAAPNEVSLGNWHFERKTGDFLTKENFISFYDRLGKYLHADNPWGNDKGLSNLVKDMPEIIIAIRSLLSLHFTTIRTPEFSGIWVIEAPSNGISPRVITGQAYGEFVVQY